MAQTSKELIDTTNGLVQDFWQPLVERELRDNTLWASLLLDPNYEMAKVKGGDTLKIGFLRKSSSSVRSIGTDADTFDTNTLLSTQVDLKVNKRAVSAYEFEDLAIIMSQLESEDSQIREALLADVKEQINDFIVSQISPITASPDHTITSVTDYNAAQLSADRARAANQKWASLGEPMYLVLGPDYYTDLMDDTTIGASNIMGTGMPSPMITGRFGEPRMGFNVIEDYSISHASNGSTDIGYAFIPSFMKVVIGAPRFKISDQHALKKFGFVMSVDIPFGVVQLDNKRVISITN